ncbi:MAG: hypothetical protein ABSE95_03665 [Thermodesulfobacteriota bacterium]|jgi:hypothetical protein
MKRFRWELSLGAGFVLLSALFYLVQIGIFHTPRDTFFYLFQDLAFVPIQVLLVTLIINQLMTVREKQALLKKLNMVIGVFFGEVGALLLKRLYAFQPEDETIRKRLLFKHEWSGQHFISESKTFKEFNYHLDINIELLKELKVFLLDQRVFLLRLLENPSLLEHDSFTDLLWAVFHLTDELACRETLTGLPANDLAHLAVDMKRALALLISEWLVYLKHLKEDYPYLFSLEVRKNPFDPEASAIIR